MAYIPRKPVPQRGQDSSAEQISPNTNVDEALDASSSRIDVPELEGSPATQQLGQTQSCEHFSDEDDSTIGSAHEPPPAYEHAPQEIDINQEGFHASATTAYDGRVDIKIDSSARRLSRLFTPALQSQLDHADDYLPQFSPLAGDAIGITPALNIVIQIVGSRGDVQPFISLGLTLQKFGHRVRIATHATFRSFIEDLGLEFFSIGGDPADLMAFMVKNPGLMPSFDTVRKGEVQKRRRVMREILRGCWRSCIEAGNGLELDPAGLSNELEAQKDPTPFVADAIIANPPTFAHLHCAEKLGIPLHLMFTMPWSSTQAFAHPLANIQSSNEDENLTNYLSYMLVEMMTWQGLGDVINRFRRKVLGLEPVDPTWAPGMVSRLEIPYTYCWSPSLIPKPRDWGHNISIAGFFFLALASSYTPSPDLVSFLEAGPAPVYIGFGSIVADNPHALTETIFEAVRMTGVRALVSKGWGGLGESVTAIPPNIFMLGNCPHDWLFERVSCVIHHGGAGTTAAGIAAGKPTIVIPFFGDQPFWGSMVARAGAGPQPIPIKKLTASNLAAAITNALEPPMLENARILGLKISEERGSDVGVKSFHDRLPLRIMSCSMAPHRVAAWKVRKSNIQLSAMAATVLRKEGLLDFHRLKLFRPCDYDLNHGPWDPVSGGTMAIVDLFYDVFKGIGEIGSEFIRVPNVSQDKGESSKAEQRIEYRTQPTISLNKDDKIVGARAAKGLARLTKATLRSPMTFTVAMAQGSHNAPKMWGDKTVRPQEKITGLGSGLKAAGKELALQTYDGVSGLVTQPIIGAREEGPLGAAKGLGKGFMGAVFKPFAGMSGLAGYSMKGVDVAITKSAVERIFKPITAARMAQGELEYRKASEDEKKDIIKRWKAAEDERQKNKKGKSVAKEGENGNEQNFVLNNGFGTNRTSE